MFENNIDFLNMLVILYSFVFEYYYIMGCSTTGDKTTKEVITKFTNNIADIILILINDIN